MKKINALKNKLCKCQEKKPNVATQLNNIREDLPASKMMAMRLKAIPFKRLIANKYIPQETGQET